MRTFLLTATLLAALSTESLAQAINHDAMGNMASSRAATKKIGSSPLTDGTVVKVDKAAATITLQHSEVKPVGMPAMTMAYEVREPGMLTQVKAGDKVRFSLVQRPDKTYAVASIERKH